MRLEFAFLADAATVRDQGIFDAVGGGFDVVTGKVFPATKYAMALIARFQFAPEECGTKHELRGEIVDGDGKAIFTEMRGEFTPPLHPRHPDRSNSMTVCLNCQGVTFPVPGDYFFRLSIDNLSIGQVNIEAILEGVSR
jgi:hypothetical protein